MSAHILDSLLLGDLYTTPAMRAVWDDRARLQSWLDVEAALASAEATVGLIPVAAAAEIRRCARADQFDLAALRTEISAATHPLVPVVRAFARICGNDMGQYVHWGATTQDITDTGLVLQIRATYHQLLPEINAIVVLLRSLASEHRATVMAGRTHGQQALPITFGLKCATWLLQIERVEQRLRDCQPHVLVGQLGGAVGTLAALGSQGLEVQRIFCAELNLGVPRLAWHNAREGLSELLYTVALLVSTLGNIAHEIICLQRTELAEVEEPHPPTKVGSSTMPHKRNPMICESILGLARLTRQHGALALDFVFNEHERDWSTVQAEWAAISEACLFAAGAVGQMRQVLTHLVVYPERMRANMKITGGLLLSEAVMMKLAPWIGRGRAHDLVHDLAMQAVETNVSFVELLAASPEIMAHLPLDEIEALLDPSAYIGLAITLVEGVIGQANSVVFGEIGHN